MYHGYATEIHQKINNHGNDTEPDTSNINKQKQRNQNEPPTSENGNPTQPNNPEQTLSQEKKVKSRTFKENYEQ